MTALRAILLCLGIVANGSAVSAQLINIMCGETRYSFQPEDNFFEMADRNDLVDWQFDGEWLRLTSRTDGAKIAFSSKNGYRLTDGNQEAAGCLFEDPGQLALLPMSEGAQLRLAFLALSEDQRKEVQFRLAQYGYYQSTIDGLWGTGTERSTLNFFQERENTFSDQIDIRTPAGAQHVIEAILSTADNASACTECLNKPPEQSVTDLELDHALRLYNSNQREEAIEIWRRGATEENARAMYNLGFAAQDRPESRDYETAAMWYERAANKGYVYAMREIARLHYNRNLLESDTETAIMWYQRYYEGALSEYGDDPTKIDDAFLIRTIAWMFENGVGVSRDLRKAYVWYKAAADLGDQTANQKLSELAIFTNAQPETNRGIEDVVIGITLSQVLQKCSPINYSEFRCRNRPELFEFFVDDGPFSVALGKRGPSIWTDGYGNRLDSDNTFVQKISVNAGKHLIHNQSKDSKYNQILSILQNKYGQNYRYSQSDYFEALSTLRGELYYLFDNGKVALGLKNYFGNNGQFDVIVEYRSDALGRLLLSKYVSSSPKDY